MQICEKHPGSCPIASLALAIKLWKKIYIDFAGSWTYLCTLCKHSLKKPCKAIDMKITTNSVIIQQLQEIFAMFELSEQLVSDKRP